MDWERLCAPNRQSRFIEVADPRTEFLDPFSIDAERITYTSVFRRLQGKTQVFPLPIYDYLRTRLTHTNEVANVGKHLAKLVGKNIVDRKINVSPDTLGQIVYTACLAHDLGNPPFGHSGEEAIRDWFDKRKDQSEFSGVLSDANRKNDFLHFDGNAQGFRIVTDLSTWGSKGGMRLTYPVLAAFSKYPYPSSHSLDSKRKYGYPFGAVDFANMVFETLGLPLHRDSVATEPKFKKWTRHPLAYLVEAADDISYLTSDVDDAHRMRNISEVKAEAWLNEIISLRNDVKNDSKQISDARQKISYLRSVAATTLMRSAVESFDINYDSIISGEFNGELLLIGSTKAKVEEIKEQFRKEVFRSSYKLELEAVGYNVIQGLLELFGEMIVKFIEKGGPSALSKKNENLYYLLPEESRQRMQSGSAYDCMTVLTDYVSGMTDRYALDLYQKIYGNSVALGKMT
jgi:dGTPase